MLKSNTVFTKDPELGLMVIRNEDSKGTNLWLKYEVIGKNTIMLYPKVIDDEETGSRYEGVAIAVNSPAVSGNLTISELYILLKTLNDVDIFAYGQLLMAMIKSDFLKRSDCDQEEYDLVEDKLHDITEIALNNLEGRQNGEGNFTEGGNTGVLYRN